MTDITKARTALSPTAFLNEMLEPELPRHLVAINEAGIVTAATFTAVDTAGLEQWIGQHNGVSNLYFSVNRLKDGIARKKATWHNVQVKRCGNWGR